MTSFLLLLLGALVSLVISRICKSANVYTGLMLVLMLGFIIGSGIKSAVANASSIPPKELVTTDSSPMLSGASSTVVGIVDDPKKLTSKDILLECDTVVTYSEGITNRPNSTEIEDDS